MRPLITAVSLVLAGSLAAPAVNAAGAIQVYVVRPGDTLYQISLRYGVPVDEIASANRLDDPSRLAAGRTLRIPPGVQERGSAALTPPVSRAGALALMAVHRVRSGDTLLGIGGRYGVPVDAIKKANGLWTDVILPGQQLAIPTWGSVAVLARQHPSLPRPVPVPRVAFERTVKEGSLSWKIIQDAKHYLGVRYVWGAASARALDCSGFVYRVFSRYLRGLARLRTYDYFGMATVVAPQAMLPGDLVFFTTDEPGPSHMGIFIGGGYFIHASSTATGVTITSLDDPFYAARFLGVRRLLIP